MTKERDVILILEGGAMAGIFSAGVVSAFEKANIYDRIESVYCASVGAQVGAHFISKKIIKTTEIYKEELLSKRSTFVHKLSIKEIIKKVFNLLVFRKHMHLLDLEVLKKIQKTKSKINIKTIQNSQINFYVKIFDTKTLTTKLLDGKKNTYEAINISSHAAPYIYMKTRYKHYYDGEIMPDNKYLEIIKENPNKKIIYVMNERRTNLYSFIDLPIQIIHFIFKSRFFGLDFASYYLVHFFDTPTINKLKKYKNVSLIYPDLNIRLINPKINTNKKSLKYIYDHGFKKGINVLKKLNIDVK
jgi:predicted patatin/cPLA2 family phospholipase